jgi:hypothetical protein
MWQGSILDALFCAMSYFYMASAWGGYVFILNLIPLHVIVSLLCGRYSARYVGCRRVSVRAVVGDDHALRCSLKSTRSTVIFTNDRKT